MTKETPNEIKGCFDPNIAYDIYRFAWFKAHLHNRIPSSQNRSYEHFCNTDKSKIHWKKNSVLKSPCAEVEEESLHFWIVIIKCRIETGTAFTK